MISLVVNGFINGFLVTGGLEGGGSPATAQFFEQALLAKLNSITSLTSIIGTIRGGATPGIFKTAYPQTYDLGTNGPALTYSVPTKTKGQLLAGGDSTATARVQIDIWTYTESAAKQAMAALYNNINGVPGVWGDGSCQIMAVIHQGDSDADEQPKAGSDQWLYHSFSEYMIQYRLSTTGGG